MLDVKLPRGGMPHVNLKSKPRPASKVAPKAKGKRKVKPATLPSDTVLTSEKELHHRLALVACVLRETLSDKPFGVFELKDAIIAFGNNTAPHDVESPDYLHTFTRLAHAIGFGNHYAATSSMKGDGTWVVAFTLRPGPRHRQSTLGRFSASRTR